MIYFPDTCEPAGFENIPNVDAEQFGYQEGWQIGIYSENEWEQWRAHGILIDDIFFIVWLDQEHALYPK